MWYFLTPKSMARKKKINTLPAQLHLSPKGVGDQYILDKTIPFYPKKRPNKIDMDFGGNSLEHPLGGLKSRGSMNPGKQYEHEPNLNTREEIISQFLLQVLRPQLTIQRHRDTKIQLCGSLEAFGGRFDKSMADRAPQANIGSASPPPAEGFPSSSNLTKLI